MEMNNDPIIKDMIGTIKHLTTIAYNKGFREGEKQIDYVWPIY